MAASARDYARRMGRRIRELRRARGLSSKELATRAGITPNSLSRIELGRHDVTLSTLGGLLVAMGWGYADLVEPETGRGALQQDRLAPAGRISPD